MRACRRRRRRDDPELAVRRVLEHNESARGVALTTPPVTTVEVEGWVEEVQSDVDPAVPA